MRRYLLAVLVALSGFPLLAQGTSTAPVVDIAPFRDDRVAALSFTLDDGLGDQFSIAEPMFNARGMHATFFIIPGRVAGTDAEVAAKKPGDWGTVTWARLKQVLADGHEIGSHSWSHPNLSQQKDGVLAYEVGHADDVIKDRLGVFPLTFCYPGNGADDRVQTFVLKNHLADRNGGVCLPSIGPAANFGPQYRMLGYGDEGFTLEKANGMVDDLVKNGWWGVTVIHGIVVGYAAMPSAQFFAAHLDHVQSLRDKLWVDTMANVAGYRRMFAVAKVAVTAHADHSVTFTLTADLPPLPVGVVFPPAPLTLRVMAPGATSAEATRNGKGLPVMIKSDRILLSTETATEPITVTWK